MHNEQLKKELEELRAQQKNTVKPEELDKFQIATVRFIDTLHGHLCGNHSITTIDNARATCELIKGITQHLKKKGIISTDISLLYTHTHSTDGTDEEPCTESRLTDEMYKISRKRSNFSKHADKDAQKTLSYNTANAAFDLDHLLFNMTIDYEMLHSTLITQGLLDTKNEQLYPVQQSALNEFYRYRQIYHPGDKKPPRHEKSSRNFMKDLYLKMQFANEIAQHGNQCMVPAGVAACIIHRSFENRILNTKVRAEKLRELGVWPVDVQKNASIKKEILSQPQHDLNK